MNYRASAFVRASSEYIKGACLVAALMFVVDVAPALAQESQSEGAAVSGQSRESMAVDATATQWSYQFAIEGNYEYQADTLGTGGVRPEGPRGFLQFRLVAPIPKSEKLPVTLLPRLTLRLIEEQDNGNYGIGQSDIFILTILNQWAKGRWGLGPQINFPAKEGFGNPNWGFGFAGAITQRELSDKLFLAVLLQQVWSKQESSGNVEASPLGINAIIAYQLGKGWYIGNGEFVIRHNWQDNSWFVPLRIRVGKAFIGDTKTWNTYIEYGTALEYGDWNGAVADHTVRINIQLQIPMKM